VNQKYGPGVFRDFLLGRYFRPRREDRVFMFLDLRGSTAIAERLGEERYFRLLQDLFRDVTPAILSTRGQIYQYVGDEIVVSWPLEEGVADGRCVSCFRGIRDALRERGPRYREAYGLEPELKAGLHCGSVMAGEVGIVKREITFSGDVLNTASRIQGKCNDLGVDLLISGDLMGALPERFRGVARALGDFALRGRSERIAVYTV
jgi:adenylate cyclase